MRLYDYDASGNCFRVRLLLALTERPYERVALDIFAGDTLTDEFARLNPLRETPVLELDDGRILTQSNAILWHLAVGTPWLPEDAYAQGQVLVWLFFEQEQVMGGIGGARFRLVTNRATVDDPLIQRRLELGRDALDQLEQRLAAADWLVGDAPTIADLSVFAYAHKAPDAGFALADWPAVERWCERIRALPGYPGDLAPYPPNAMAGAGRSAHYD